MASRKIFNYESIILIDKTIEDEGYHPDQFGKTSNKFIWATCRFCGEPSRVRKGQFTKRGSACHKECRLKEQSICGSPFQDPAVKKKAEQTNLKRYGTKHASSNDQIRAKISAVKKTVEYQDRVKKTVRDRYGVDNVFQSEEIKDKIKNNMLANHGVENPQQSEKIRDKTKQTCMDRYQVENPMQNTDIHNKAINTNLEKYGVPNPMQNEDVKSKGQQTNIERYGAPNVLQNAEIRNKVHQTNMMRYGCISPMGNQEVRDKAKQTFMKNYGVENPFASPKIRKQIEDTFLTKYGVHHPLLSPVIREKIIKSFIDRLGVDNPMKDPAIAAKVFTQIREHVKANVSGKFDIVNTLRSSTDFWQKLTDGMSVKELAIDFDLYCSSLYSALNDNEFKSVYNSLYTYPKHQLQNEVKNEIKNFYKGEIIIDSHKVIPPLEIDIFLPEKKFAIEFNGSLWHSEAWLTPADAYTKHIIKTKNCQKIGVRLFHVFQTRWSDRRYQIINFIRTIVGCNEIKIDARKCHITQDNTKDFIAQNHIQGFGNRTIRFFNLVAGNNIVASMTASLHHRQTAISGDIVLNRLCFNNNHNVRGGANKLFKQFVLWAKKEGYQRVVSWSDNCWTDGNIYEVLGFELAREYNPDYFYWNIKSDKYLSKQSQRKKSTKCPPGLTEREWCMHRGLYRIWDCGKKLWVYNL